MVVIMSMIVPAGRVVLLREQLRRALYRVFGPDRTHVVCTAVQAF